MLFLQIQNKPLNEVKINNRGLTHWNDSDFVYLVCSHSPHWIGVEFWLPDLTWLMPLENVYKTLAIRYIVQGKTNLTE